MDLFDNLHDKALDIGGAAGSMASDSGRSVTVEDYAKAISRSGVISVAQTDFDRSMNGQIICETIMSFNPSVRFGPSTDYMARTVLMTGIRQHANYRLRQLGLDPLTKKEILKIGKTPSIGKTLIDQTIDSLGPRCFPASTLISTSAGDRAISDIRVGDLVWAFDGSADKGRGGLALKRVSRLYRNVTDKWLKLSWGGDRLIASVHVLYFKMKCA